MPAFIYGLIVLIVRPIPSLDVDAGADSAAVSLFIERARTVARRFSLSGPDEAGLT
jgi:hypothetical protein